MQTDFAATRVDSLQMAQWIEENLNAKSMDFARLPGGETHTGNPVWFTSGMRRVGYNGITFACFAEPELDERIEESLEPFRKDAIPLTWWVGPLSKPKMLGSALQRHGFRHNRDMIGMAAKLDALTEFAPPSLEYSFEPVLSRTDLEDWLPLFMETFGIPLDEKELTLNVIDHLRFSPQSQWKHYLIRVKREVVATSSLHMGAGMAGLYNIATRPDYRQHGLGTAITLLTFEHARQLGYTIGTLQTTYPNALRLYHRMGFEVYCKFGIYQKTWQQDTLSH